MLSVPGPASAGMQPVLRYDIFLASSGVASSAIVLAGMSVKLITVAIAAIAAFGSAVLSWRRRRLGGVINEYHRAA